MSAWALKAKQKPSVATGKYSFQILSSNTCLLTACSNYRAVLFQYNLNTRLVFLAKMKIKYYYWAKI